MVQLDLQSIAYEAKTLNLAKEGFTAYYVDATDGLDIHDGGSWAQAFKTIQHAIDESESWAKIFVKAGTYVENVSIDDKQGIHIIGENRETTIINGGSSAALYGNTTRSIFEEVTLKTTSATYLTQLIGVRNRVQSCVVDSSGIGLALTGNYSTIDDVRVDAVGSPWPAMSMGGSYGQISNCVIDCACDNGIVLVANTHYAKVFENIVTGVVGGGTGIQANAATTTHNTIFHNNLVSNANQLLDNGSNNTWFENYYDNHTTDTNKDGMTDTAYTEGGATDYQPVSRRNGWEQESIGNSVSLSIGNMQVSATTMNLNQAAATYTLFTGTTQTVILEKLVFRMPNVDISAGALTSISIKTDDATPAIIISAADGVLANLTHEASLTWTGALLIPVGTLIQLVIAGGLAGIACSCDVVAESRAVVNLGHLA